MSKLGEITIEGNVALWMYIYRVILAVKRKIVLSADMTIAQVPKWPVIKCTDCPRLSECKT